MLVSFGVPNPSREHPEGAPRGPGSFPKVLRGTLGTSRNGSGRGKEDEGGCRKVFFDFFLFVFLFFPEMLISSWFQRPRCSKSMAERA